VERTAAPTRPDLAGANKSTDATGIRHDISTYLAIANNGPDPNGLDDGSPIYDALDEGYDALAAYPGVDERIMPLTDGGFSCTSLRAPPRLRRRAVR
jgi:hypothetical protein